MASTVAGLTCSGQVWSRDRFQRHPRSSRSLVSIRVSKIRLDLMCLLRERAAVSSAGPVVRNAEHDDVMGICRFGEAYIRPHYAPLIGAAASGEC